MDTRFFKALCPDGNQKRRNWDPKHVIIAGAVATIIRRSNPDKADAVPVVLIARMEWESELANAVEEEIGDTYPFQLSAAKNCPLYASQDTTGNHEHQNYTRLLNWCLRNEEESVAGIKDLLLKPLIPLIYLDMFRIRNLCEDLRHKYAQLLVGAAPYESLYAGKEVLEKIHSDMPNA